MVIDTPARAHTCRWVRPSCRRCSRSAAPRCDLFSRMRADSPTDVAVTRLLSETPEALTGEALWRAVGETPPADVNSSNILGRLVVECDQEAPTIELDGGAVVPAHFVGSVGLPWPKVVVAASVEFDSDRRPGFLAQMVRSADGKPVAIRDVPWSEVLRRLVLNVTALYLTELVRLGDFPSLSDMQPVRETLRAGQTRRRLPSNVRAAERPPSRHPTIYDACSTRMDVRPWRLCASATGARGRPLTDG